MGIDMANLAIKGHSTQGKEVINLLEMLGGTNDYFKHDGKIENFYYYIGNNNHIYQCGLPPEMKCFTLEEFLEKYPYKVGDEVEYKSIGDANLKSKIKCMEWCNALNKVLYLTEDAHVISTEDITETKAIPPYMDYDIKEDKGTLVKIDFTRELRIADEVEVILGDYEFVLKNGKTYFIKKKPQYPTTYVESCSILGFNKNYDLNNITTHDVVYDYKLQMLYRILICRDAYWKIAGEEMGLGQPWKPDWEESDGGYRYCIRNQSNKIVLSNEWLGENYILAFPTAEMRDAFYANFKDLIEQCKELL